jgi:hypothetical protein
MYAIFRPHRFSSKLAGTTTPTVHYNTTAGNQISRPGYNTAIGTAFAFSVKAMLPLAVWAAYILRTGSLRGQRLSSLDTTSFGAWVFQSSRWSQVSVTAVPNSYRLVSRGSLKY